MAEKVSIMTGGKFSITVYQKDLLAKGSDIFQKVKEGTFEIGMGQPHWWRDINPAWSAIQSVPFGFMNLETSMMFFLEDEGTHLANQLSNPHGILWRPASWSSMEFGILTTFPARYLSDLNGKTFMMEEGLGAELFRNVAGVQTVQIPPTEIHGAIRNGKIQGVEWGTPGETFYMKFHRLCDYAISPALWHPSVLSDFLINQDSYDQLPYAYQIALETSLKAYTLAITLQKKTHDITALERFLEFGTEISIWSPEDTLKWKRAADQLFKAYSERSYSFKRVLEFKKKFKLKYDQAEQLQDLRNQFSNINVSP